MKFRLNNQPKPGDLVRAPKDPCQILGLVLSEPFMMGIDWSIGNGMPYMGVRVWWLAFDDFIMETRIKALEIVSQREQ